MWIYSICNEVVNILAALGIFWNVSNTIMGILVLAPANSIGDYVADTALARSGKLVTAFGAVYSGPLLNLLMGKLTYVYWSTPCNLGVGISCTIANITNGAPVPLARTAIEFACAATVEYALFARILILVFSNFEFKRWVGYFFLVSYVACLSVILAAGLHGFGFVPQ